MYIPEYTKVTDKNVIFDMIEQNSFGLLVTGHQGKLKAVHIPMILSRDAGESGILYGHISAANDLLKNAAEEALAVFQGPHCYISSSWYETDQSVPTWNYLSVHAYGTLRIAESSPEKLEIVNRQVLYYEDEDSIYNTGNLAEDYLNGLLKGIIAFEMRITKLEAKMKLSQNHSAERQLRVIENLEKAGDENSVAVAGLMKKNLRKQ